MLSKIKVKRIEEYFLILLLSLLGVSAIVFSSLYSSTFNDGLIFGNICIIDAFSLAIITLFTILSIIFLRKRKGVVFKLSIFLIFAITIISLALYLLKLSGIVDKISSIEQLRQYVMRFNNNAVAVFVLIQFLQVVVLPIPSVVTTSAGVLLFGAVKGAILSCFGIISGSIFAHVFGKIFGIKVLEWLFGKNNIAKWLERLKGKDKLIITLTMVLPFFPDDMICFLSGLSSIKTSEFIFIVMVFRSVSIFVFSLTVNSVFAGAWVNILIIIAVAVVMLVVVCVFNIVKKRKLKTIIKH